MLGSSFPHSSSRFAPQAIVEQILQNLPGLNSGTAEDLRALAGESDRDSFFEGILSVGRQLEATEHPETAGVIYSAVVQNIEALENPSPLLQAIAHRAQCRLDAVNGVGAIAPRGEFLLRHLARQAIDPSMIVGMGVAGIAYRTTRLAILSRLAGTVRSSLEGKRSARQTPPCPTSIRSLAARSRSSRHPDSLATWRSGRS